MRDRERGFTLVEILVVLTIIAAMSAGVLAVVPRAIHVHKKQQCASRLHQLGVLYATQQLERGGRPARGGAGYFLSMRSSAEAEIRRGQEEMFVCPGDPSVLVPNSPEDRAAYDDVDLDAPSTDICSFVVRDFRAYPVAAEAVDLDAIAADRQGIDHRTAHHRGGVNVLFADGSVKFMGRAELGLDADGPIVVGPDATNEMLAKLVYATAR